MKKLIIAGAMMFAGACASFVLAICGSVYASPVPELDPGTAGSGIALLAGGFLLLLERHRRHK